MANEQDIKTIKELEDETYKSALEAIEVKLDTSNNIDDIVQACETYIKILNNRTRYAIITANKDAIPKVASMTSIDKLAKSGIDLCISKIINNKISVHFDSTYIKDDCFLNGSYGVGDTVEEAAADYIKQIEGKPIVINPSSKNRREITFTCK